LIDPLYQKFIIEGIKREQGSDFSIPAQTEEQNGQEKWAYKYMQGGMMV
jgi:hypothetical protein